MSLIIGFNTPECIVVSADSRTTHETKNEAKNVNFGVNIAEDWEKVTIFAARNIQSEMSTKKSIDGEKLVSAVTYICLTQNRWEI